METTEILFAKVKEVIPKHFSSIENIYGKPCRNLLKQPGNNLNNVFVLFL